jgi:superfamily II DNA or RNA helicase
MKRVVLAGVDPASLADAVGGGSYTRGVAYFHQGAVAGVRWDVSRSALAGNVHGSAGELYTTTAFFTLVEGLPPQFEDGRCSCPVGFNCKHVVALILAATGAPGVPAPRTPSRPSPGPLPLSFLSPGPLPPEPPSAPSWERSLESLLGPGRDPVAGRSAEVPVAVELTLGPAGRPAPSPQPPARVQPLRLLARLVQPGQNGGWILGSLSWSKLASLRDQGGYHDAQLALLEEIYALYHARGQRAYYSYSYGSYGDERSIDLSAFPSAQLWALLDRAEAAGLQLRYARKRGTVPAYGSAELYLDVTASTPGGPLMVTPLIRVDGARGTGSGRGGESSGGSGSTGSGSTGSGDGASLAVRPLAFIGAEGHGLVYVDAAQAKGGDYAGWPFRLARLATGVPPALQRMALDAQPLEIPGGDQARFRDEYCPRLRHVATIISSDQSFRPPQITGPVLVLTAAYGPGHDVAVSWAWEYQVGDTPLRTPLPGSAVPGSAQAAGTADGYRDPDAERALLASLDLPLGRFGLLCSAGPPRGAAGGPEPAPAAGARLTGIDTMRLTTELLPLLAGHPGVRVEITGSPADYRAADDSLSIDLSTDEVPGDTDWFDLGVTITVAGHQVPFTDVFLALGRGESHLLLADGAYFSLDKPELRVLAALIEEARALADAPREGLRISRFQAGLWDELTDIGVVRHQARAWEQQVAGLLAVGAADQAEPPRLPATLTAVLRPYQLAGFQWLAFLWRHQLGGILADDMGLGKTLQSLALIAHARQGDPGLAPFLIVAPTSVVPNWAAEAARFVPGLTVVPVTETAARRGQPLGEVIAGADVVVTSYALLRIDYDRYAELGWSGLILDEAQFVKNHQSRTYQCARRLPAPFKLAITGTPMENNLMELWSLLSITAPGLFPSPARFRDFYARPIEAGGQAELLRQFRRRIRPLVKRRTKEHVAPDLPAKQEQVLEVELHPRHRRIYETHLQRERQKILGLIRDMNANRFTILRSLTLLRQLSLHAGLADEDQAALPCAKIDALLDQLRDVAGGGHRALVFSQFTGFLRMVAGRLDADGLPYCYLDGSTRDRAAVLAEFREGTAPVFLISLKAGGFGLNLTEADYCFLLDPWWNPATEAQAVDRTHRIGQTRNVMVYRLIAKDTIEEKVMALKQRKAELFTSVIDNGDAFGSALDADDIRGLIA